MQYFAVGGLSATFLTRLRTPRDLPGPIFRRIVGAKIPGVTPQLPRHPWWVDAEYGQFLSRKHISRRVLREIIRQPWPLLM